MYFKSLSVLLPLATAVAGYIVPADLPDGLYLVPLNESNPTPQRVDLATVTKARLARSAKFTKQLAKRLEWAGTGHSFPNHGDYNACTGAWRDFWANGNSVPGHFLFLCTVGEAVLAGCNYTPGDEQLEPQSVDEFNGFADAQFGFWNTGWVHSNPEHAGIPNGDWTYWRDIRGTQFCTNLP